MTLVTVQDVLDVICDGDGSEHAMRCSRELVEDPTGATRALPSLWVLRRRAKLDMTMGDIVCQCLRAYSADGLLGIYCWAKTHAPSLYPTARKDNRDEVRQSAIELYSDCYLVIADWVSSWNRRQMKVVA